MIHPIVADLSHHNYENRTLNFIDAKAAGTIGVIYKSSEGSTYQDSTYASARKLANSAGLLWGAYHFGTAAKVSNQVENFLKASQPDDKTLVCLDFEKNELSEINTITIEIAIEFLELVTQRLGRKPKLYTGPFMYEVFGSLPSVEFQKYKVWWARYADIEDLHPTWNEYWLWQYSDGHNGPKPHQIPGFGFCDCNHFNGTAQQLRDSWVE